MTEITAPELMAEIMQQIAALRARGSEPRRIYVDALTYKTLEAYLSAQVRQNCSDERKTSPIEWDQTERVVMEFQGLPVKVHADFDVPMVL